MFLGITSDIMYVSHYSTLIDFQSLHVVTILLSQVIVDPLCVCNLTVNQIYNKHTWRRIER